jgi:hypothetical protein
MLGSLEKIVRKSGILKNKNLSREELKKMVADPGFQNSVAPLLHLAYDSPSA